MLRRSRRLSTENFNAIMEKGRITHSPFFIIKSLSGSQFWKVSVTAPKKIAKTAVLRNKLRRRMYESIKNIPVKEGNYIVIIAKNPVLFADKTILDTEMKSVFVKADLIK